MRGGTRMKMDADNCVSRFYGRYGDENAGFKALDLEKNPCCTVDSAELFTFYASP